MEYNDEILASFEQYEKMSKAYMANMRKNGFMFIKVSDEETSTLISHLFTTLGKMRSCLFFMGGFLGTEKIFTATDRHIESLKLLFDYNYNFPPYKIRGDKTKCLLNFLSLESSLIKDLLLLSKTSSFSLQLERIVHERLNLIEEIFNFPNLLISFSR